MGESANITIKNQDGTVESAFVVAGGSSGELGSILNNYYQDETKVRRLISLTWISHVGLTTQPSPLVKHFGGEWYQNRNLMATLGQKEILTHLGGGVFDYRPNPAARNMTDEQIKVGQQVKAAWDEIEGQYTLAEYRDGLTKLPPSSAHQDNFAMIASNDYQYVYEPQRPVGNKWSYTSVSADDQYMSYKDFPDNGIKWYSLKDILNWSMNIK